MHNRRKKYLLNPRFQLTIIGVFITLALFALCLYYGAVVIFFERFVDIGNSIGLADDHAFFKFLAHQKSVMNLFFFTISTITTIIIAGIGLFLSHRIAGPIYRLCKYLEDKTHGNGDYAFKLRDGDFFPELTSAVNDYMDSTKREEDKKDIA